MSSFVLYTISLKKSIEWRKIIMGFIDSENIFDFCRTYDWQKD